MRNRMRVSIWAILATLVVVFSGVSGITGVSSASAASPGADVLAQTNSLRQAKGLDPLRADPTLNAAAQQWANQMSAQNFTHSTNEWRQAQIPAGWSTHGENIAVGYSTPTAVMSGWINSPGHYQNLVRPAFTRLGVGYNAATQSWVQIFAGYASDTVAQRPTERIAGEDRYATAVTLSRRGFPGTAPVVYLATGTNYPDALAAAPAATADGGPLLLSPGDRLLPATRAEILRLKPGRIVVIGGEQAISPRVVTELRTLAGTVDRIMGADRFDTAAQIMRATFPSATRAYIATGRNFPDALSAAAVAGGSGSPVILVNGTDLQLDAATTRLVASSGLTEVVIVGGAAAVSPGIASALTQLVSVQRIDGADRFVTSSALNRASFASAPTAYLATGNDFPDALAGASLAAAQGVPLAVVRQDCIPPHTERGFVDLGVQRLVLIGGTAALSDAVRNQVAC